MDSRKTETCEDMVKSYKYNELMGMNEISEHCICQENHEILSNLPCLEWTTKYLKSVAEKYTLINFCDNKFYEISDYYHIIRTIYINLNPELKQKLKCLLNYVVRQVNKIMKKNLLDIYILHLYRTQYINTKHNRGLKISHEPNLAENQLQRLLKVCKLLPPEFELSPGSNKNFRHYFFISDLLKYCHKISVSNSNVVIGLLKLVLRMHTVDFNTNISQHTDYLPGFYKYILYHANKANFDLGSYISAYPNTIWDFASKFSLLDAVASGDEERVLCLLDSNFEIFPVHEKKKCENHFKTANQIIPESHLMVLDLMRRINEFYLWKTSPIQITHSHKLCFKLLCSSSPQFPINPKELKDSVNKLCPLKENESTDSNFYRNTKRFEKLYKEIFKEMKISTSSPCSLQTLCAITVRSFLRRRKKYPKLDSCNRLEIYHAVENIELDDSESFDV